MKKTIIIVLALAVAIFLGWKLAFHPAHDDHDDHDGHDHAPAAAAPAAKVHAEDDGHDHGAQTKPAAKIHAEDDGHDHGHEGDKTATEEAGLVHLTPAQRKLVAVTESTAAAGTLDSFLRLNGEVTLNADATGKVMPRLPGFLTKITVNVGDKVAQGALLAELSSSKLGEYYSNYNSALEREKLTRSEFDMAETLRKSNAIAQKEYLRYQREYTDAGIARRHAEILLRSLLLDPAHADHRHDEELNDKICTLYAITAPLAGTVIAKDASLGENFAEDSERVLFVVSDLSKLRLDLQAPANELRRLRPGMEVVAVTAASPREYRGRITYVAPLVAETTRTGLVRALLDNTDGTLRPGEFAVGTIALPPGGSGHVVVPRDAVQMIDGETVLFVPRGDGYAPVKVVTGESADGRTVILAGLNPGERFVSGGAFELKSILIASGMDPHAGHGH